MKIQELFQIGVYGEERIRVINREIENDGKVFYLSASLDDKGDPLVVEVRDNMGNLVYFKDNRFSESLEVKKFDIL